MILTRDNLPFSISRIWDRRSTKPPKTTLRQAPQPPQYPTLPERLYPAVSLVPEPGFLEILDLIKAARQQAYQSVNASLIDLYWNVGAYISRKLSSAEWGDSVIPELAAFLARTQPGLRGFAPRNLFRMRQFYETYAQDTIVSPLVTQLSWSHHLEILVGSKRPEERAFYIRMAVKERWSKRELERQIRSALFERAVLNPLQTSAILKETRPEVLSAFKDAYIVEFLNLPRRHTEKDLHRGLLHRLKEFMLELGRDFCFVGSEFPLQVGMQDFALDLLFFHRGLNCLIAIELKVERFSPQHLGQLNFYLEALDRDVKKSHENPAIGVLLCGKKDQAVVEYALSRSLSPTMIAEYQTMMPDKALLQAKLQEFYQSDVTESEDEGE